MTSMPYAKRIIPCLDVDKNVVVKGVKFQNLRIVGDPVELASRYEEEGADELVILDVTASVEDRKTFIETVRAVCSVVTIPVTVGGGIKTLEDASRLFNAGADKVSINTGAVQRPELISEIAREYGRQATVVAIDAKRKGDSWEVYIKAGKVPTGLDAIEWAKEAVKRGAGELLVTSIDADGTKQGYDLELYRRLTEAVNVPIIASGGAGAMEHFYEVLKIADAALAASLFHFRIIEIPKLKKYLAERGIPVRLV